MPTPLADDCRPGPAEATWTAAEFVAALAPHTYGKLADPVTDLAPITRRAHAVAALWELGWNPHGRYPISVWDWVYR